MYEKTDDRFASVYWHWFFLLQPSIPERFILADPHAYYNALVTRFPRTTPSSGLGSVQTAVDEWRAGVHLANLSRESSVAAMCEDYRASAPADAPDLDLDRHDRQRGHKIACPLRVIWGKHGVIHALYDALDLWQKCAHQKVEGRALDCGHYIPEEAPHEVLARSSRSSAEPRLHTTEEAFRVT